MRYRWHYSSCVPDNKRYTWVATAMIGGTLIGGGISMYEGAQNREAAQEAADRANEYNSKPPAFAQLPDYAESTAGRENWWQTLQDWQKSGNYGVNEPNYDAIKENALRKVNQYYWGGATGGGLIDKIKASAARRGVSDSPSLDVMTSRLGAEQAGQIGDVSTQVDTTKAAAVEGARQNWLSSITNLANLKPSFVSSRGSFTSAYQPSGGMGEAVSTLGTGVAQYYQNQQDQDWYTGLIEKYAGSGAGNVTQSSMYTPSSDMYGSGGMFDLGAFA